MSACLSYAAVIILLVQDFHWAFCEHLPLATFIRTLTLVLHKAAALCETLTNQHALTRCGPAQQRTVVRTGEQSTPRLEYHLGEGSLSWSCQGGGGYTALAEIPEAQAPTGRPRCQQMTLGRVLPQ